MTHPILTLFVLACSLFVTPTEFPFAWLSGTWSITRADGSQRMEIWDTPTASMMTGRGIKVNAPDTTLLEHLMLEFRDGTYWYIPTVPDQNQGRAVRFLLKEEGNLTWIFENPAHDFPQRIIYRYHPVRFTPFTPSAPGDTLSVRVEDLKGDGFDLTFIRI